MRKILLALALLTPFFANATGTGRGDCDQVIQKVVNAAFDGDAKSLKDLHITVLSAKTTRLVGVGTGTDDYMTVRFNVPVYEHGGIAKVEATPGGCFLSSLTLSKGYLLKHLVHSNGKAFTQCYDAQELEQLYKGRKVCVNSDGDFYELAN